MLLKVRTVLFAAFRHKSSHDYSRIPTSIGALTPHMTGSYERPPPVEETFKKPRSVRYLLRRPTHSILDVGPYKHLPDAYRRFYIEWKLTNPKPVHIDEQPGKFYKNEETGQILPVQNVPLPIIECPQEDTGLWGGEAVVQGYYHYFEGPGKFGGPGKVYDKCIYPRFWYPTFEKQVIYSEILDKHMATVMTRRAMLLINDHRGLDNYILETRACDLRNLLALKLKRKMLQALLHKSLCPDDEVKQEELYSKFKHHLDNYTPEEIEWYGLTLKEACFKNYGIRLKNQEQNLPVPLKHQLRKEFINYLKFEKPLEPSPEPWYKKKLLSFK